MGLVMAGSTGLSAIVAMLVLLVAVPVFVVVVLAVLSGYLTHDATQFVAELEADVDGAENLDDENDS